MPTEPLRKIVGYVERPVRPWGTITKELLECGHVAHPKKDIYGETNAVRRRCWKCAKGLPADESPA
jgi:hypothetical protein